MTDREKLMKRIASVDFAIADLNLFMDSHPNNPSIVQLLQKYSEKSNTLRKEYEDKYGPLTSENMEENRWGWISDPWPWDKTQGAE